MKLKISEIKLNPKNPRVLKDWQFEKLKKSIEEFPEMLKLRPIVVDENNMILGGNARFKALKELGYKDIEVIRASELTEEKKREFIIKDNTHWGRWDMETLYAGYSQKEIELWNVVQGDQPNFIQSEELHQEVEKSYRDSVAYPITILANENEYEKWQALKASYKIRTDLDLFTKILKDV
jgi:hypothetical protein